MTNDSTVAPARANSKTSKPGAGTGRPVEIDPHWAEFANVYLDHLAWLIAKAGERAETVTATAAAKRSNALLIKTGEGLHHRPLPNQRASVTELAAVCRELDAVVGAGGDNQTWEWDRLLGMAVDFTSRAFGFAETEMVDTKHVRYLSDLAAAQVALVRVLDHTADSWAELSSEAQLTEAQPTAAEGYTREQLSMALEVIAGRTATLNRLLMMVQGGTPVSHECSVILDAAQAMAETIGAMADTASGAGIVGSHDAWNFGTEFADLGKADAA